MAIPNRRAGHQPVGLTNALDNLSYVGLKDPLTSSQAVEAARAMANVTFHQTEMVNLRALGFEVGSDMVNAVVDEASLLGIAIDAQDSRHGGTPFRSMEPKERGATK